MYKKIKTIEWVNDEAETLWKENKDLCLDCGQLWCQVIHATHAFAVNIQDRLKEGQSFNMIVDEEIDLIVRKYGLCKAQANEIISTLVCVWIHGDKLRAWSNIREGAKSDFPGLYFSY